MHIDVVVIRSTALHGTSTGIATRPQPPACAARLPADHVQAPVASVLVKPRLCGHGRVPARRPVCSPVGEGAAEPGKVGLVVAAGLPLACEERIGFAQHQGVGSPAAPGLMA